MKEKEIRKIWKITARIFVVDFVAAIIFLTLAIIDGANIFIFNNAGHETSFVIEMLVLPLLAIIGVLCYFIYLIINE